MAEPAQMRRSFDRKEELISELGWARAELSRNLHDARNDLDLVSHFKHSVTHRKTAWFAGAAVVGWVLSRLPGRRKADPKAHRQSTETLKEVERAGLLLTLLNVLFTVFKPALTALASKKITELAARGDSGWRKPFR